jgi:hypothetical protein
VHEDRCMLSQIRQPKHAACARASGTHRYSLQHAWAFAPRSDQQADCLCYGCYLLVQQPCPQLIHSMF